MLLILGLLGFIQAVFLPGAIIYRLFNLKTKFYIYFLIIVGISIAINSNIVFLLVLLNIYSQKSMLILIIIETILLLKFKIKNDNYSLLYKYKFLDNINSDIKYKNKEFLYFIINKCKLIILLITIYIIIGPTGISNLGQIFINVDAIVSWNSWAVDLATGGMPVKYHLYSQLLPSILSIPYVLMEDTWIQFFSYAICLLFPTCICLMILSLFEKFPIVSFIMMIIVCLWPIKRFVKYMGYVDFPLSFIGFLAVATILWGYKEDERTRIKCLLLSSFFLGSAAAIKQLGFLLILFFPLIIIEFKILSLINIKLKLKTIILFSIITLFFALPWNIYIYYSFEKIIASSHMQNILQNIHLGRSLFERLLHVINIWPGLFIFTLLAIPGILIKNNKSISIFGILIMFVWIFCFSYDNRNSYLALFFISFSIGLTIQNLFLKNYEFILLNIKKLIYNIKILNKAIYKICIIIFSILIIATIIKSDSINKNLYKRQDRKILEINNQNSDNIIISNLIKSNNNNLIITNDVFTLYLTKYNKDKILFFHHYQEDRTDPIEIFNKVKSMIKNNSDKKIYLYIISGSNKEFIKLFFDYYFLIFQGNGFLFTIDKNYNNII
jgi:hypothetical protein